MSKLSYILIAFVLLVVMEGIAWLVLHSSSDPGVMVSQMTEKVASETNDTPSQKEPEANLESENFPAPSIEVVGGVTERTIHMGVRQWEWDPKIIYAKEGERVRLVIHNADVHHTLVIPELGVDIDIPEDGAVGIFLATKKGTFDFLCGTYCGMGHAEMQGTLVVE